jgi:GNAT superfamily N-acetyltransferase
VTATAYRDRESARPAFTIERVQEARLLREWLAGERAYAAYAIAQLEPHRFRRSEWYTASGPEGRRGLVLHSASGLGRALFVHGDPDAVDAILGLHPGARFSFASLRPEHLDAVRRYFVMTRGQLMYRMAVAPDCFQPAGDGAVRLRGADVSAINRLYSIEGGPTAYRPAHVEEGVYYGLWDGGRLIAIAGTHAVSAAEGVAVVGNVFTHPRYRSRGYSTIVTSAVTRELLERCPLVVLTVEASNEPAIRVYRRLGYRTACTLHESPLIRKEPAGILSAGRRLLAGWRGRRQGKEIVLR